jgi:proline- and glutamine-rich splicing factor
MEKVSAMGGPTYDLPPLEPVERKFSGHCRLYVGNLTNDITEEEVNALFASFGQTAELFLNKDKNFAFIRLVSNRFRFYFVFSALYIAI